MRHYKLNLKGLRIIGAFMCVVWVAAIVLTAVGSLGFPRYGGQLVPLARG